VHDVTAFAKLNAMNRTKIEFAHRRHRKRPP